jgi:hypothetical protein
MLGMAAADLMEQIRVLTAVHRATEHPVEPAMKVPRLLPELPADWEII